MAEAKVAEPSQGNEGIADPGYERGDRHAWGYEIGPNRRRPDACRL